MPVIERTGKKIIALNWRCISEFCQLSFYSRKIELLLQNSTTENRFLAYFLEISQMNKTRRERLKSALYLRLRKRKTFFLGEKLKIFEFFSFANCRIMPKNVKVGPFGFINIHSVAKFRKKTRRGTLWGHLKNLEKNRTVPKKSKRGTLQARPALYIYLRKWKMKGGPFGPSLPWP